MENLKKLRLDRHLSQKKLAETFDLSQQSVYKYENNLAEPDIRTLKDFAAFFHTSVDYLIGYSPQDADTADVSEISAEDAHVLALLKHTTPPIRQHIVALLEEIAQF